jgi:signal transduction histidine kinase
MLQFTQRFNLYVLIALIAVTVVGGSLLLWLWWRLSRERRRREALAQSRRYLAEGREKERERLAQEIHDGPVQDLHGLHMQLKALSGSADGRFETMGDELMRVTRELRAMSADLHPPALQRFGLAAALRSHADRLRDRHPDLQIELDLAEGNALGVPQDEYALSVFRIAQEAMNNAVQHGQARCIQVSLQCADNTLELDIRDDGDGFTPPDDWHALAEQDHYGLLGMRERAGAIGATLDIDSAPGEGPRVRLRSALPPAHPAEEHAAPPASVSA